MKTSALTKKNKLTAHIAGLAISITPALTPSTARAGHQHCGPQAAGHGDGQVNHPAHGNSFGGWLVRYFDWLMGDGRDGGHALRFLPLPEGVETGGSFTYDDPGILEGEAEVTLKPGQAFMVPIVAWVGELYEDGSADEPLSNATMCGYQPTRFCASRGCMNEGPGEWS